MSYVTLTAMEKTQLPSNKKFGLFFAAISTLLAGYACWRFRFEFMIFALICSFFFVLAAFLAPRILSPLNRLWHSLGLLLGEIVSPIVLGFIFFMLITPVSLLTRLLGRDELKLNKRDLESYWIDRTPPGPASDSFNNQF